MSILVYMQLRNEDRFAKAALASVQDIADDALIVFDRCEDETRSIIDREFPNYEKIVTLDDEELLRVRKSLLHDFENYEWILMVNGDEVYDENIRDLPEYLAARPIEDVTHIVGHTVHVLNEDGTLYTPFDKTHLARSTTKLIHNWAIEDGDSFNPWLFHNLKYKFGSAVFFDIRHNIPVIGCFTVYHMHFLNRSSVDAKVIRRTSPNELNYPMYILNGQQPLFLPFLKRDTDE